jgi:hypothetical protein
MTDADSATPTQSGLYREIACAIRAHIPLMKYSEVRDQLRLLARQYEKLAQSLEGRVRVFPAPELGWGAAGQHSDTPATAGRPRKADPPGQSTQHNSYRAR